MRAQALLESLPCWKRRKKKNPHGRVRRPQRQRLLSGAFIVDSGRGMCRAGFLFSRCVLFSCRQGPDVRHHGQYDQENSCVFRAVICSLFSFVREDTCYRQSIGVFLWVDSGSWEMTSWQLWYSAQCLVRHCAMFGSTVGIEVHCVRLRRLVFLALLSSSLYCQAHDTLHHGRYGLRVLLCRCCLVQIVEIPQLQFIAGR